MNDLIQVVVARVSSLALDAAQPVESIFIYGAATLVAKVRVAERYTQTKASTDGDTTDHEGLKAANMRLKKVSAL